MLRFLHAADLHLCSPLAAFSAEAAVKRRNRQFDALEQLFGDALKSGIQMVLLAGDVFDTPAPDADSAARLFAMLGRLPVPVVIAPGNHDYFREGGVWQRHVLPDNVYVFDQSSLSCFDFAALGVAVYGYAFTAETMGAPVIGTPADLLRDRTAILLAHADLLSPLSPYAPITAGQLERCGFAYVALGHIHKPTESRRYGGAVAAYSGFFAGRGFDEAGAGQALLVEVEGSSVNVLPLQSAADRFEVVELDLTGARNNEEIYTRLRGYLEEQELSPYTALRVCLTGSVGLSCHVDRERLQGAGKHLALFEVRDETLPIFDGAYLEKDPTLKGAFYRALLPRLTSGDAETRVQAAEALRLGFAALSGKEV